jgi:hypothetical protein
VCTDCAGSGTSSRPRWTLWAKLLHGFGLPRSPPAPTVAFPPKAIVRAAALSVGTAEPIRWICQGGPRFRLADISPPPAFAPSPSPTWLPLLSSLSSPAFAASAIQRHDPRLRWLQECAKHTRRRGSSSSVGLGRDPFLWRTVRNGKPIQRLTSAGRSQSGSGSASARPEARRRKILDATGRIAVSPDCGADSVRAAPTHRFLGQRFLWQSSWP